ncbi:tRNA lysidine(34) synthetase TilS [Ruegeria sp.]|uniref:tRNA lysidine(34) synthetase TilS n=1 Tax=Ruegeria sp. TaxID=1879320 RepID=UPI00231B688F|nr:tRNA lysidine(34) synthetase TilS [Ruegeria sp.]MDA7965902.1 tRNA lysidine(34) synthetase TilS [Ruegeria sp.]
MTSNAETLRQTIRDRLPDPLPRRLGVAVSGGGDSIALLCLLADTARTERMELFAATVDHGLRPESATEAETVAAQAQGWNIPHETLKWDGWDGTGNLQDAARRARYHLLTEWAKRLGLDAIALGHTADDQAETVLMRLGRAAGVSGLSAMAPERREKGVTLLRPLLSTTREDLRDYLGAEGVEWIEDPSNHDQRFDRIKARAALSGLDQIGITAHTLSRVAENMAQARAALAQYAQDSARRVARVEGGDLCLDRAAFEALPEEIRRRILAAAVLWIAGGEYTPRHSAMEQALKAISMGKTGTIGGCIVVPNGKNTWICRELKAVAQQTASTGTMWDGRWIVTGPITKGAEIRALGEDGITQLEDWRVTGKPRAALLSSPAVWTGQTLLAAPLAGWPNQWRAEMPPDTPDFHATILSH